MGGKIFKYDEICYSGFLSNVSEKQMKKFGQIICNIGYQTYNDVETIINNRNAWICNELLIKELKAVNFYLYAFDSEYRPTNRVQDYIGFWKKKKDLISLTSKAEKKVVFNNYVSYLGVASFPISDGNIILNYISHNQGVILASKNEDSTLELEKLDNFLVEDKMIEFNYNQIFSWLEKNNGIMISYHEDGEGESIFIYYYKE